MATKKNSGVWPATKKAAKKKATKKAAKKTPRPKATQPVAHTNLEIVGAEDPAKVYNAAIHEKAEEYCELMRKSLWFQHKAEKGKPYLDAKMLEHNLLRYELPNGDAVEVKVKEDRKLTVTLAKGKDGKMIPPEGEEHSSFQDVE